MALGHYIRRTLHTVTPAKAGVQSSIDECDLTGLDAGLRQHDGIGVGTYDQKDAHGFIKLNALRLRTLRVRGR